MKKETKKLIKSLVDLCFVPSSGIRLMRKIDREHPLEGKIRKGVAYSGMIGFELARLGLYYTSIFEPIYKTLAQ